VRIAICDVGLGNIRSVERALVSASASRSGVKVEVSRDPEQIRRADKVVIPGQGAFGDCARALADGMGSAVRERIAAGAPYLGICLGLQILFASSDEAPGCVGLGVFEGDVGRLRSAIDPATGGPLKIPHMGWNTADRVAESAPVASLLSEASTHFYFVHSFVVRPKDERIVASTTDYGERFVSAIAKDNVFACQFHPEKSQGAGIALLERFVLA
jgi:glutamine amidotransferase